MAVRDAFASLTRRLEDLARRQRGAVKQHASVSSGEAKYLVDRRRSSGSPCAATRFQER